MTFASGSCHRAPRSWYRFGAALAAVLFLAGGGATTRAATCTGWTLLTPPRPTASDLGAIAWGPDGLVAVGEGVQVLSSDGSAWTASGFAWPAGLDIAASADATVVVVGDGRIVLAPRGEAWRQVQLPVRGSSARVSRVARSSERFVATGWDDEPVAFVSGDGAAWRRVAMPYRVDDLTWDGARFVALVESQDAAWRPFDAVAASPDGESWAVEGRVRIEFGSGHVASDGRTVVAGGTGKLVVFRGIGWVTIPIPEAEVSAATWTGQVFAIAGGRSLATSPDGEVWTWQPLTAFDPVRDIVGRGPAIVAVGDHGMLARSTDGVTWSSLVPPRFSSLAANASVLAGATGGAVVVSADGRGREAAVRGAYSHVRWTGDRFVALGAEGRIATSRDGIDWTETALAPAPIPAGFAPVTTRDLTWRPGQFVLASGVATNCLPPCSGPEWTRATATGPDLVTWSGPIVAPSRPALRRVVSDGARLVGVTDDGALAVSDDLQSWTEVPPPSGEKYRDAVWTGTRFVAFRDQGISVSTFGLEWQFLTDGVPRGTVAAAVAGGDLVAVGGKTVTTSHEGSTWTSNQLFTRGALVAVAGSATRHFVAAEDGALFTRQCTPEYAVRRRLPAAGPGAAGAMTDLP